MPQVTPPSGVTEQPPWCQATRSDEGGLGDRHQDPGRSCVSEHGGSGVVSGGLGPGPATGLRGVSPARDGAGAAWPASGPGSACPRRGAAQVSSWFWSRDEGLVGVLLRGGAASSSGSSASLKAGQSQTAASLSPSFLGTPEAGDDPFRRTRPSGDGADGAGGLRLQGLLPLDFFGDPPFNPD